MHDGHDRADVQKYLHEGFLPRVQSYLRRTRFVREIIDPETGDKRWEEVSPELLEGEREVIWVNQDESLCYANDDAGGTWLEEDKNYIEMKGNQVHRTLFYSHVHLIIQPSHLIQDVVSRCMSLDSFHILTASGWTLKPWSPTLMGTGA